MVTVCLAGGSHGRTGDGFSLEECEIRGSRRCSQLANTCRRMDSSRIRAISELPKMHAERSGDASTTLAFPVSPLELNTNRGGGISR